MHLFMATESDAPEAVSRVEEFLAGFVKFFTSPLFGDNTPTLFNICIRIVISLAVLIIGCLVVKRIVKNIENEKIFKRANKTVRTFLKHLFAFRIPLAFYRQTVALFSKFANPVIRFFQIRKRRHCVIFKLYTHLSAP